jgi:hypothetical protein
MVQIRNQTVNTLAMTMKQRAARRRKALRATLPTWTRIILTKPTSLVKSADRPVRVRIEGIVIVVAGVAAAVKEDVIVAAGAIVGIAEGEETVAETGTTRDRTTNDAVQVIAEIVVVIGTEKGIGIGIAEEIKMEAIATEIGTGTETETGARNPLTPRSQVLLTTIVPRSLWKT